MASEQDDEYNRRKLEEIGALEARIRGKRSNWLIILFVGTIVLSSCGFCATLTGHDIAGIVSPTMTPKGSAISNAEETDQSWQEQLSYIESLENSEQQPGNDPSSWEQWLNSTNIQYQNSTYTGNETIAGYNDTRAFFDSGSAEYMNITEILQSAYADNENESAYYDQMISEFNNE